MILISLILLLEEEIRIMILLDKSKKKHFQSQTI